MDNGSKKTDARATGAILVFSNGNSQARPQGHPHEAIRKFFYSQIPVSDLTNLHKSAALYYKRIYESQLNTGIKNPSIIAELVHHLSLTGGLSEIKSFQMLVTEEIKPAARALYREHKNWTDALSLYRLLSEILPDDPQVLAYIGRCYGRLGQWQESDLAFRSNSFNGSSGSSGSSG